MRKLFYILFIACFIGTGLTAQNFQWAKHFAGSGSPLNRALNYPRSITTDASGNVYSTGCFGGTVDFDPSTGAYPLATVSLSNTNVFISKLTPCGDFIWAKSFAGLKDDQAFCVKIDNSGNVITSGHFSGTTDFDPGVGIFNLVGSASDPGFISKLDASGNFVWAKKLDVITISVFPDASGNIYASGSFSGTVDFDPGAGVSNLSAAGSADMFVVKLDASGNFVWAKKMGSSTGGVSGIRIAKKILVDASSNLYAAISFSGTVDFDPGAGVSNLTASSSSDVVIIKLDAAGNLTWAKRFGGGSTSSLVLESFDADALGNSYFSGVFSGTVDFDPSAATFNLTSVGSAGGVDIFYAKIDASGNLTWAKRTDVNATNFFLSIISIASDSYGNAYVTGNFNGTVDFDPSVATRTLSATSGDLFISTFDAAGNFKGAVNSSGLSMTIGTDNSGSAYVGSFFGGVTTDFDSGPGTYTLTINPANHADIALIKFNINIAAIAGPTTVCSGSTATYSINALAGATGYTWTVPSGAVINSGQNTPTLSVTFGTLSGTVSVTPSYTCVSGTSTTTLAITVNATPTIGIASITSNNICRGAIVTITPNGATSYTLMPGSIAGTSFTVSPTSTSVYTINGTNAAGCASLPSTNLTTTITVNSTPTIGITSVSSNTICRGTNAVITPNGAITYTLMPGGSITGTSFTVSPIATTVYTINGTTAAGCVSSSSTNITTTITVNATPTIGLVSVSSNTICSGTSVTITPNGATTYTLMPGNVTGTSFTVSPNSTTTYTINGTNTFGCSSSSSTNLKTTITVNTTPTIGLASISSNAICSGNTVTITPSGASTYTLVPGNITGTSFTVAPLVNTTYTIRGTSSAGCLSNSSTNLIRTITIDITPTITIVSVSNSSVCSGNSSVITPGGASTYTLLPGSTSGTSFTVNPLSTTVYTINGTSAGGCVNNPSTRATATIIVNTTPTIALTSISNTTICAGSSVVIIPNGASTYTLLPNNITGNSFTVTPSVTTSYTINGANSNGCVNNNGDGIYPVVTVSNLSITITSTTGVLCFGDANGSSSVSVSGGSPTYNYLWSNGITTSSISGVTAGNYTVTVTDGLLCSSSKDIIISGPTASLSINSISVTGVCSSKANGGVTISVTGGTPNYNVLWNTGATGQVLSNVVSGAYTATITDGNNCTLTLSEVIPSLSESDAVCVELFIPEIFSPNADGVNDKFEIKKVSAYPNNTLSIFNRWGSLVYKKQGYNNEWNGTSNVGDKTSKDYLPASTYYVVFDFGDGNTKQYTGFVQLEY